MGSGLQFSLVLGLMSHMKAQKVLIFTAGAGAGHISCSHALKNALLEKEKDLDVQVVDMYLLSKVTAKNGRLYSLVGRVPLFETVYNLIHILVDKYRWFAKLAEFVALRPLYKPTMKVIEENDPDIVVGNNALLIPVLDWCRRRKEFRYFVTVTDLITVCRWWASELADTVFVPTEEAEKILKKYSHNCNIARDYFSFRRIEPLSEEKKVEVFENFFSGTTFSPTKPLIVVTGGGFSTRKIMKGIKKYIESSHHQFVILTGKDKVLYDELQVEFVEDDNVLILGFTDRNLDLIAIADVVISKFGSVSVVELEEMNKKTIFTKPVGYQEYGNVEYIKRNRNFVFVGSNHRQVVIEIERFLVDDYESSTAHIQNASAIAEYILQKRPVP